MSAPIDTTPITDEQLSEIVGDDRVNCEAVWSCSKHGEEYCDNRARWIAVLQLLDQTDTTLVCDSCRDVMESRPDLVATTVLEWRPL